MAYRSGQARVAETKRGINSLALGRLLRGQRAPIDMS